MPDQIVKEETPKAQPPESTEEPSLFPEEPKRPKKGKGIFLFLFLFVILALAFFGRSSAIQGEAVLKARNFVKVDLANPGILREVFKKEGDPVEAGALLARLENPEVSEQLRDKNLALEILNHDKIRLEQKKAFFTKELERKNVLIENGAATRAELEAIELDLTLTTEELSIKGKQTESLQNEISFLKLRQDALQIKAPFHGVIIMDPTLSTGNYMKPGDVLFQIADPTSFYLELPVPERAVERLSIGDRARIRFHAFPSIPFTGMLARVGARTQEEVEKVFKVRHVILCEITLDRMPPSSKYGMHATVRIMPKVSIREGIESRIGNAKEKIGFPGKKRVEDFALGSLNLGQKTSEEEKK